MGFDGFMVKIAAINRACMIQYYTEKVGLLQATKRHSEGFGDLTRKAGRLHKIVVRNGRALNR
jgi:hypothetical protein